MSAAAVGNHARRFLSAGTAAGPARGTSASARVKASGGFDPGKQEVIIVSEGGHSDEGVQEFREKYIRMGLEGAAHVAIEGATVGNSGLLRDMFARQLGVEDVSRSSIFGLEQEASHALTGLLKAVQLYHPERTAGLDEDQWDKLNRQILERFILPLLDIYPTLREAWRRLGPEVASLHRYAVYGRIDEFVAAAEKGAAERKAVLETEDIGYDTAIKYTVCMLARYYAELLVERPEYCGGEELPEGLTRKLVGESWVSIEMGEFTDLIVDWRNREFTRSLRQIAERLPSSDLPLVIIVGRAHAGYLKSFFRETYGINPRVLTPRLKGT
jgi:hypothetical protein